MLIAGFYRGHTIWPSRALAPTKAALRGTRASESVDGLDGSDAGKPDLNHEGMKTEGLLI